MVYSLLFSQARIAGRSSVFTRVGPAESLASSSSRIMIFAMPSPPSPSRPGWIFRPSRRGSGTRTAARSSRGCMPTIAERTASARRQRWFSDERSTSAQPHGLPGFAGLIDWSPFLCADLEVIGGAIAVRRSPDSRPVKPGAEFLDGIRGDPYAKTNKPPIWVMPSRALAVLGSREHKALDLPRAAGNALWGKGLRPQT